MMNYKSWFRFRHDRHKNAKLPYFMRGFALCAVPKWWCRFRRKALMKRLDSAPNKAEIIDRVNYYNKLTKPCALPPDAPMLGEHKYGNRRWASVYFFDSYEYTRFFSNRLHWLIEGGDVTELFPYPTIVKSRPIGNDNTHSVLLKMDKVRHFIYIKDSIPFEDKKPIAIFAGWIGNEKRRLLFEKYFSNPRCELHHIGGGYQQWHSKKVSIEYQLHYRYIISIEGNDVASNLKWVMSSNSIAVMPRPKFETWFMEGRLIPNYHYIEVKPDYSDLLEKLDYYDNHPQEALEIIKHANQYTAKFRNRRSEDLISLLVLDKYFSLTNPLNA